MSKRMLLTELLRIITPDEINLLTTLSESEQLFSLTDILEKQILSAKKLAKGKSSTAQAVQSQETKAKILPFNKNEAVGEAAASSVSSVTKVVEKTAEIPLKATGTDGLATVAVAASSEAPEVLIEEGTSEFKFKKVEEIKKEEVDLGEFIIHEKEKLKNSQGKLKGHEVLELYKKTAAVDVDQERVFKHDLAKSTNSGVLVNKRQN